MPRPVDADVHVPIYEAGESEPVLPVYDLIRLLRPEVRRERLVEAATKVFAERGYEGASVDEIAAEADMSTGAIHYWFEVRDEVLIAALKWASGQLFDRLERDEQVVIQCGASSIRPRGADCVDFTANDV